MLMPELDQAGILGIREQNSKRDLESRHQRRSVGTDLAFAIVAEELSGPP